MGRAGSAPESGLSHGLPVANQLQNLARHGQLPRQVAVVGVGRPDVEHDPEARRLCLRATTLGGLQGLRAGCAELARPGQALHEPDRVALGPDPGLDALNEPAIAQGRIGEGAGLRDPL